MRFCLIHVPSAVKYCSRLGTFHDATRLLPFKLAILAEGNTSLRSYLSVRYRTKRLHRLSQSRNLLLLARIDPHDAKSNGDSAGSTQVLNDATWRTMLA
jgi:hypothetical protein